MREVVSSAIEALKGSPGLLTLVLLNALLFVFVYLAVQAEKDRDAVEKAHILDYCLDREKI